MIRRTLLILASAIVLAHSVQAWGQESQSFDAACSNAGSNAEYKSCVYELYQDADRKLNALWKRVLASIDKADHLTAKQRREWKSALRDAQRSWVKFKERDCNGAMLYEWWGGSGAGGAISNCLLRHTVLRMRDLSERYLSN